MKLINKTNQDIIKNKNLNSKFLSANFEKLQINCKILKDDFYLDSYNYFPITKEYYTYREIFSWGEQYKYDNFYTNNFENNFESQKNKFKELSDVTVLGSSSVDNYYRNIITFLPRIFFLKEKKIKLAIHRNLSNKFRNLILFLAKKLELSIQFVFLDDGFYSFKHSQIPQFLNNKVSIKILNNLRIYDSKKKEKIYLKRQNSTYRNIINEQDIIDMVKDKGFRIVDLNNLNILEQIKLFSNAETIISPTSSGLTNIIFCSSETNIIEITPQYRFDYEKTFEFRYKYICNQLGISYQKIEADPINLSGLKKSVTKIISPKVLNESNYYKDMLVRLDNFKKII